MEGILFQRWNGPDGIRQFIINQTECMPFSGEGIGNRLVKKTAILRSVDNTYYYDDNLNDINNVEYTLFGHNGNQDENERRYNEPLLNPDKIQHIYLYRVRITDKKKDYIWYGKYKIVERRTKPHIGKDKSIRTIIILRLSRIEQ